MTTPSVAMTSPHIGLLSPCHICFSVFSVITYTDFVCDILNVTFLHHHRRRRRHRHHHHHGFLYSLHGCLLMTRGAVGGLSCYISDFFKIRRTLQMLHLSVSALRIQLSQQFSVTRTRLFSVAQKKAIG